MVPNNSNVPSVYLVFYKNSEDNNRKQQICGSWKQLKYGMIMQSFSGKSKMCLIYGMFKVNTNEVVNYFVMVRFEKI